MPEPPRSGQTPASKIAEPCWPGSGRTKSDRFLRHQVEDRERHLLLVLAADEGVGDARGRADQLGIALVWPGGDGFVIDARAEVADLAPEFAFPGRVP